MKVTTTKFNSSVNILKHDHTVSVPFTVDFTSVNDTDETGMKILKAGTIMKADGTAATASDTPAGILLHDVREDNPNTALIIHGFVDKAQIKVSTGADVDETLAGKLTMIAFL